MVGPALPGFAARVLADRFDRDRVTVDDRDTFPTDPRQPRGQVPQGRHPRIYSTSQGRGFWPVGSPRFSRSSTTEERGTRPVRRLLLASGGRRRPPARDRSEGARSQPQLHRSHGPPTCQPPSERRDSRAMRRGRRRVRRRSDDRCAARRRRDPACRLDHRRHRTASPEPCLAGVSRLPTATRRHRRGRHALRDPGVSARFEPRPRLESGGRHRRTLDTTAGHGSSR